MWISEEEGCSREMREHSKELVCSRNSKEAGVAGARQMGYVGEDVVSNTGPGGSVTWKFTGVCWVNDRSNLIGFKCLVPFVILRRDGQAMGRLRKTSEGTFARTQLRAEFMPSCHVILPVNNSDQSCLQLSIAPYLPWERAQVSQTDIKLPFPLHRPPLPFLALQLPSLWVSCSPRTQSCLPTWVLVVSSKPCITAGRGNGMLQRKDKSAKPQSGKGLGKGCDGGCPFQAAPGLGPEGQTVGLGSGGL